MQKQIELGALSPKISEQLKGTQPADVLLQWDRDAAAITRLHLRGLLTDDECDMARSRLIKALGGTVVRIERGDEAGASKTDGIPKLELGNEGEEGTRTSTDGHGQEEEPVRLPRVIEGRKFLFEQQWRERDFAVYRVTSKKDGSVAYDVFQIKVVDGVERYPVKPKVIRDVATVAGWVMDRKEEFAREGAKGAKNS